MPRRWVWLVTGLLLMVGGVSALPGLAQAKVISEFAIPTANSQPLGITWGPDGNVWFTESAVDKIGRITPGGTVTEFGGLTKFAYPNQIVTGPDGNLWFTESGADMIGRITPDGKVTEFSGMTQGANPFGITVGADGNLWFTEWHQAKVGKITPDGTITEYSTPTEGSGPQGITAMADGTVWFTESFVDQLGQVTTDGKMTEYSAQPTSPDEGQLPPGCSDPNSITDMGGYYSGDTGYSSGGTYPQSDTNYGGYGDQYPGTSDQPQSGAPGDYANPGTSPDQSIYYQPQPDGSSYLPPADYSNPGLGSGENSSGQNSNSYGGNSTYVDPGWGSGGVPSDGSPSYVAPAETEQPQPQQPQHFDLYATSCGYTNNATLDIIPTMYHPNQQPSTQTTEQPSSGRQQRSPLDFIKKPDAAKKKADFPLNQTPEDMALGPDGELWVAERGDMVARLTPDGKILQFRLATANSIPTGITAGADGNVWFTELQGNKIGRVNLKLVPPAPTEAAVAATPASP